MSEVSPVRVQSFNVKRVHVVRIGSGQDLLGALRRFAEEHKIRSGVILNGIGSAVRYRVHAVKTVNMPPGDEFFGDDGPYDILDINGFILDGRVHAHVSLSNTKAAIGGHLEEGTVVLTMSIVTIAEAPKADISGWDRF